MDAGKAELKMIMLVCLEICCKLDGKIRIQGCSCWWRYWIRKEMELSLQEVCVAASSCCCSNGRIGENEEGTGSDAEKHNETGGVEFVVTDLGGEVCNWCN
ncbi:hypothetical protein C5167_039586 [Papaver somniferum]|uniref:Uncharacterized protein n=1 Tax=Papaver somniferum TaxID=3469 RepID=A0A4Y7IGN6_PAPSO|nr:hypothetical protein C5167_039586 [Papaver somniferum]